MNIMTIVVLAVLTLFAVGGLKKGLIRKVNGVVSIFLASVLVSMLLPYVTGFLKNATPVYDIIRTKTEETVSSQITSIWLGKAAGQEDQNQTTNDGSYGRDQIKQLMDQYGLDSSRVDGFSDEQLEEYVEDYLKPYLAPITGENISLSGLSSGQTMLDGLSRIEQTKLIKSLPVPGFLQKMMITYNNSQGYKTLGVQGFGGYLSGFIANVILNIAAFLATLIIVHMLLWAIMNALDLFARLPILYEINHAGGLVVGLLEGIVIVWIAFLILSALSGTQLGMTLMGMVDNSIILKPIYQGNLFLKEITGAVSSIM